MKTVALLTVLVALAAAGAATAATPAQYRATMNGICRSYTPKLKQVEKAMVENSSNPAAYNAALQTFLRLGLAQDRRLEAVAVPASLKARMSPILSILKKIDVHLRASLAASLAGDTQRLNAQVAAIAQLSVPLNPKLDAAGLRSCGSGQS